MLFFVKIFYSSHLLFSHFSLSLFSLPRRTSDPGPEERLFSPLLMTVHAFNLSREDFSPLFPHGFESNCGQILLVILLQGLVRVSYWLTFCKWSADEYPTNSLANGVVDRTMGFFGSWIQIPPSTIINLFRLSHVSNLKTTLPGIPRT